MPERINEHPKSSTNPWLLKLVGYFIAVLTGISVFVLLYAAGYRGRGIMAIAFLTGSGVLFAWRKIATNWLPAIPFLALFIITAIVAKSTILPKETIDDSLYQAVLSEFEQPENRQVFSRNVDITCQMFSASNTEFNVLKIQNGRSLNRQDIVKERSVCLVSYALGRELFPVENPVAQTIRVDPEKRYFTIVGVVDIGPVNERLLFVPKRQVLD